MYPELEKHLRHKRGKKGGEYFTLNFASVYSVQGAEHIKDWIMQTTFKETIDNHNSKDNNSEMLDMKLPYLSGFDGVVQISSPNMCSRDKHSAREGALHTAMLTICLWCLFSIWVIIMKMQSIWNEVSEGRLIFELLCAVIDLCVLGKMFVENPVLPATRDVYLFLSEDSMHI